VYDKIVIANLKIGEKMEMEKMLQEWNSQLTRAKWCHRALTLFTLCEWRISQHCAFVSNSI